MCRRILLLLVIGLVLSGPAAAHACPNCREGLSGEERLPQAYMYSILYMLSMPAMLFAGFGLGFYRLAKRSQAMQMSLDPEDLANLDGQIKNSLPPPPE